MYHVALLLITFVASHGLTVEHCQKISDVAFKQADNNKDSELDQTEWSSLSTLPQKYGFSSSGIAFGDVDTNKDGKIEKDELYVYISGTMDLRADNAGSTLNMEKIEQAAKELFIHSYEKHCGKLPQNNDTAWNEYKSCSAKPQSDATECIKSTCNSLKKRDGATIAFTTISLVSLLGVIGGFALVGLGLVNLGSFALILSMFLALVFTLAAFGRSIATRNN